MASHTLIALMGEEPNSKQCYSCIRKTPWQSKSQINSVLPSCHATEEISSRHNHYTYKLLVSRILIFEYTPKVILNEWFSTGTILFSHPGDICQCWKVVWVALTKGCCGHLSVLYKDTSKHRTMFETASTFHKKEQPGPNVSGAADETSNQSAHSACDEEGLQKPSAVLAIDMWKYEG